MAVGFLFMNPILDSEKVSYDQNFLKFQSASSLSPLPLLSAVLLVHLSRPLSSPVSLKCLVGPDHLCTVINEGLH